MYELSVRVHSKYSTKIVKYTIVGSVFQYKSAKELCVNFQDDNIKKMKGYEKKGILPQKLREKRDSKVHYLTEIQLSELTLS